MGAFAQIFWVSFGQGLCRQTLMAKINIISKNNFLTILHFSECNKESLLKYCHINTEIGKIYQMKYFDCCQYAAILSTNSINLKTYYRDVVSLRKLIMYFL